MIRALQRLVRFVAWIMSRDKLEPDAEDPPGRWRDSGRRWLFAREELPALPPSSQGGPVNGGWRRFFLAPERLEDADNQPVNGPEGPARSFLRELFAAEPLEGPEEGEEATPHHQGFLQRLLAAEHLEAPDTGRSPTMRQAGTARFLRWLFSPETIDRDGRTGSTEAPLSRPS